MMIKNNIWIWVLLLAGFVAVNSCRKNDTFTKEAVKLNFSSDTVFFDTVFSKLGNDPTTPRSVTLHIKVSNPNVHAVKTNIKLAGNFYGIFKLNVDGKSGTVFNDIEIRGNDSIYIFIQAYINPVGSNTPFIVTDQILFETNGTTQDVDLVVWTQDANYFKNETLDCGSGNLLWTSDKPYVIYDSILIPRGCTLTIEAGTHIYNYNQSCILILGTLIVNGTSDKPVIFEGSRLDDEYKELAGQWIGLHFYPGSSGNKITGAIIKNGYVGIEIDSLPNTGTYGLELKQTIIKNMSAVGLLCYTAKLYAENNLVANCGIFSFYGLIGGTYNLYYNTFASVNGTAGRKYPGFYLSSSPNRDKNGNITANFALNHDIRNNIAYGALDEEFAIYTSDPDALPLGTHIIADNLLKTKDNSYHVNGNVVNKDPKFKDVQNADYDLETTTPCRFGNAIIGINKDLKNRNRSSTLPTVGAYEAQ